MKWLLLLLLLVPMVTCVGSIDANAGSVTEVNIDITQTITPYECFAIGEDCVRNLLCQATECEEIGGYIYINWIW